MATVSGMVKLPHRDLYHLLIFCISGLIFGYLAYRYFSFVTYVIQQLLNYTCPSKSVSQICTTNENTLTAECAPYCASNISYFYAHHVTEIIAILFAVLMCIYGALYAISLRHVRRYRTMTGSQ